MLGLDRHFKYQAGSLERLAELARLCVAPAVTRTRLFNWLAFNVLVGNTDAHLKNLGFLVSPRGLTLAPCYDLLSTAVYESRAFDQQRWPDATTLAWPILGENRLAAIDPSPGVRLNRAVAVAEVDGHPAGLAEVERLAGCRGGYHAVPGARAGRLRRLRTSSHSHKNPRGLCNRWRV